MADLLLKAIRERQTKNPWNRGIVTADRYVQTIQECFGSDMCKRLAAGKVDFAAVMTKAAGTLTFNNPEMIVKDIYSSYDHKDRDGDSIALPKNTLMVFKHILTTPRRDRDGDILRTDGAQPDPKMLLLWQHVHTLPIGKMLAVADHSEKVLEVISAIIDINPLAHDAAVMVENDMGRFSHGFRALAFDRIQTKGAKEEDWPFDVKSFEIMEESLVSVPSNADAETLEVLLDLVEGGKLTSPILKNAGKSIRENYRPVQISGGIDLKSKKDPDDDKPAGTKCSGGPPGTRCGCGGQSSASEETDGDEPDDEGAAKKSEVKSAVLAQKYYGSSLSGSLEHMQRLLQTACREYLQEKGILPKPSDGMPDGGYASIVATFLSEVIVQVWSSSLSSDTYYKLAWAWDGTTVTISGDPVEVTIEGVVTEKAPAISIDDAMSVFLAKATTEQRERMSDAIKALDYVEKTNDRIQRVREFLRIH